MSRFIPVGQFAPVLLGVGLGCNLAAAFLRDWEAADIIRLGFAIMIAGGLLNAVERWRRKRAPDTIPYS